MALFGIFERGPSEREQPGREQSEREQSELELSALALHAQRAAGEWPLGLYFARGVRNLEEAL